MMQVTTYKYTWAAPDQEAPNGAAVAPGNQSSSFGSTSPPEVATQSAPDGEQAASDQGIPDEPAPPPPHEHHDQVCVFRLVSMRRRSFVLACER